MSSFIAFFASEPAYPLIAKIIIAFCAGLFPVLVWLWFWEHEDKHPEPKRLLIFAFCAGMISVAAALILEQIVVNQVENLYLTLFLWALIEEILKFGAAYITVLSRTENDEPIDSMMYMITVALGFSAVENALFLLRPLFLDNHIDAINTGNLRFVGATLLHTITSGIIGLALSLSFYKSKTARRFYVSIGVVSAVVLHAFFNLSIITLNDSMPMIPLYTVWAAIIVMLLAFEKVKQLNK